MGMDEQPLLTVLNMVDTVGNPVTSGASGADPQAEQRQFRVNDPETQDPTTIRPQFYDQTNPQVAMDADGDFVVTWESVVPDAEPGSGTDIYARRFSPAGFVSGVTQDIQFTTTGGRPYRRLHLDRGKGDDELPSISTAPTWPPRPRTCQTELLKLGYDPASVTVVSSTGSSYVLRIKLERGGVGPADDVQSVGGVEPPRPRPRSRSPATTSRLKPT